MNLTQAKNELQIDCDGSVEEVYRPVKRAVKQFTHNSNAGS